MQVRSRRSPSVKATKPLPLAAKPATHSISLRAKCPTNRKLPWKFGTWYLMSGRQRQWNLSRTWSPTRPHGQKNALRNTAQKLSCCNSKAPTPMALMPARRMHPPRSKRCWVPSTSLWWSGALPTMKKMKRSSSKIAEDCQDVQLTMGPVEDKNHKGIGAAAMGYGHAIISSPLPSTSTWPSRSIFCWKTWACPWIGCIIDPTTGGLGYGMEYSYSVMERLRMAAMAQGDDKLQMPIINNLGNEIWKCKEAKQGVTKHPPWVTRKNAASSWKPSAP
jgi:hypothetical protein